MKIKKVLYVGSEYETNVGKNQKSLNYRTWYRTFKELGFNTQKVTFSANSSLIIDDTILTKANQFKPDIIFCILQKNQVSIKLLNELKKNFYLVNFFGDDNWRFESFSSRYAKYFNLCLTNDLLSVEKYKDIGIKNIKHIQWAALKSDSRANSSYHYDVSFIGAYSQHREWVIDYLIKKGIRVVCFGLGWKNGIIDENFFNQVISRSKINLNLSNSINYDIRFVFSKPKMILTLIKSFFLKNIKNRSEIKARIFEIPANNGFLLTEYVPFIEYYFDLNKEITCFSNREELLNLIKFYLNNEEERETKKNNGYLRVEKNHLYDHRVIEIIKHIENHRI